MSRFYRAVEEASRLRQITDLPEAKADPPPPDTKSADLQSTPTDLQITPEAESREPDAAETPAQWQIIEEEWFGPAPARQSGPVGVHTQIAIDKKMPLLSRAADSIVVEFYRRLRTKIIQQQAVKPFRSLIVTSPNPQEGKTLTALNLGLIFAMLPSFKVLIVDGDLRRGSLSRGLGLGDQPGLSDLIDGSAKLEDVVCNGDDFPTSVLPRGKSQTPAAELLHSAQLRTHFRRMTEHFQLVLVDSPPVNVITDTQLLAGSCDAVLLIARAFSTTSKTLEKATADLQCFRVIGTVLNGANAQSLRRYRGYY